MDEFAMKELLLDERIDRENAIGWRKLPLVNEAVLRRFSTSHGLKEVSIWSMGPGKFSIHFFFYRCEQLAVAEREGIFPKMVDAFYAEMDRMGRGRREDLEGHFEWDSDENVLKKYGSYQFYYRK